MTCPPKIGCAFQSRMSVVQSSEAKRGDQSARFGSGALTRAETITAERLSDRLPVSNPDNEMGRLATVFNATLGRLQQSFDQMRRFTADVSHELRTPLTAIRSVGEVGLRGRRDANFGNQHAAVALVRRILCFAAIHEEGFLRRTPR